MTESQSLYQPRCLNLTCKSMMVFGENFRDDPDFQAGQTEFWCTLTSKAVGPDNEEVNLQACSNMQRPCCREY